MLKSLKHKKYLKIIFITNYSYTTLESGKQIIKPHF